MTRDFETWAPSLAFLRAGGQRSLSCYPLAITETIRGGDITAALWAFAPYAGYGVLFTV